MIEVDLEQMRRLAGGRFYGMPILLQRKVIDYADALKAELEIKDKECVDLEGMLADLQDHSNLYHEGMNKGAKAERDRCASIVRATSEGITSEWKNVFEIMARLIEAGASK